MIKKYPYLKDTNFLNKIYGQHNKSIYAKITVLDWRERPIKEIQGRITSGSISVNGDSSVRRTANLSVKILDVEEIYSNPDSLISINKKIFLELGLSNSFAHMRNSYYSDSPIVWFPFGTYIIQSCSFSHDLTGVTANLSLGDKMCLLNGDAGGVIPAAVNFESVDTLGPDGDLHSEWLRINQIIPELLNHFGKEDLNKIIVNDIPNKIKQALKWRGTNPLYLWTSKSDQMNVFYTPIRTPSGIDRTDWTIRKIIYNYDAGYTYTDFVFPEELVASPGDTVCTILDKIKNKLGNFEYYYDVFGNFIFQEIKNYVNTTEWRTAWQNFQLSDYLPYAYNTRLNSTVYSFENNDFVISYNNSPQYNMIKNDFVVWGVREGSNDLKLPCRYHLAIDTRPFIEEDWHFEFPICFDTDMSDKIRKPHYIYPKDRNGHVFDSLAQLKRKYPTGIVGRYYYVNAGGAAPDETGVYTWITDIDNYYNLYNNYISSAEGLASNIEPLKRSSDEENIGYIKMPLATYYTTGAFIIDKDSDWRNILFFQGFKDSIIGLTNESSGPGYYWAEMCNEWPKLYDIENNQWIDGILDMPSSFDWWIDFIDNDAEMSKFSVDAIGRRSYVKSDNDCNCVFEPDIPDIVMVRLGTNNEEEIVDIRSNETIDQLKELGLVPTQVSEAVYDSVTPGGTFNSCYQHVRQILTDYTNYNESVTITCLPIYHLEPNTRIFLNDVESGIYGDYIINTISFNLDNSGTMTINAKKVIEKI